MSVAKTIPKHALTNLSVSQDTIDCASLIEELQALLGKQLWIRYAQLITLFVLGKRSRKELIQELRNKIMKSKNFDALLSKQKSFIKLHNRLLLSILGNSLRLSKLGNGTSTSNGFKMMNSSGSGLDELDDDDLDGDADGSGGLKSRTKISAQQLKAQNSTMENYKQIVMSLPQFDRIRLSKIVKESGKRGFVVSKILQTRLNNIPKLPYASNATVEGLFQKVTEKQLLYKKYGDLEMLKDDYGLEGTAQLETGEGKKKKDQNGKKGTAAGSGPKGANAKKNGVAGEMKEDEKDVQKKGMLEWSQEIVESYQGLLCQELYSLPDNKSLMQRMYGIMREHGLIGELDKSCLDLVILALEKYLRNLIESGIDSIRYRRKKYSDLYDLDANGTYQEIGAFTSGLKLPAEENEFAEEKGKIITTTTTQQQQQQQQQPNIALTNEDIMDTLQVCPSLMDPGSIFYNMNINYNKNDDQMVVFNSRIDDMPLFANPEDKPSFIPVDERNEGSREELNWLLKDILEQQR
ncbi:hypothetical protein ACO0QE_003722 [Hanseniaspora vineae]